MTKVDVKHIAKLANITVSDKEIPKFEKQLSEVLDMVSKLEELDTRDVEPTSQVTGLENVLREDIAGPSLTQEEALSNATSEHKDHFQVKGIFEEE